MWGNAYVPLFSVVMCWIERSERQSTQLIVSDFRSQVKETVLEANLIFIGPCIILIVE